MKAVFRDSAADGIPAVKYVVNTTTEIPEVAHNGLLIAVKACCLSQIDEQVIRSAICPGLNKQLYPIGWDISGIVKQIGRDVTTFKKGDEVVGVIPLDYCSAGCADLVTLNSHDIVKKPKGISFVDAAACVGDGVKAYTALHYLGRIRTGETVLVADGASAFGTIIIQLALHWGAKVLATVCTEEELHHLNSLLPELATVINISDTAVDVKYSCMEETAGLGIDIIVSGKQTIRDKDLKHAIVSSLAVGGRWITEDCDLQLDPPDSRTLFLKCASIGFLFEQAWTLSSSQQGRYQHMLVDIMDKLDNAVIRPFIKQCITLEEVPEAMNALDKKQFGKTIMTT